MTSGFAGFALGLLAASLWLYASRIKWTMGRERGMLPADNGPRIGLFGKTYFAPGALEPYLNDVSKWNSRAAFATALSMLCWAAQTLADLLMAMLAQRI